VRESQSSSHTAIQEDEFESLPSGWWRPVLLFFLIAAALILGRVVGASEHLKQRVEWIRSLGNLGYVVFVGVHIGGMIAAIPRSVLAIAAGVLFGPAVGILLVMIAAPMGAGLAFLIARYFARSATARWVSRSERLGRLLRIVEERGAVVLVVTRLATFAPANVLNYAFGLTGIPFSTYMFWSFLCMLPVTIVYVIGGDIAAKGISQVQIPWVLVGTIVLAVISLLITVRYARQRILS
jgi:uncharacterized membrane protein YdjX (TVP38/TMEM64 family)